MPIVLTMAQQEPKWEYLQPFTGTKFSWGKF